MAWLACDSDGTECIYALKPIADKGYWSAYKHLSNYVVLPDGGIEKIIGRKLNFEDGCVEMVEVIHDI